MLGKDSSSLVSFIRKMIINSHNLTIIIDSDFEKMSYSRGYHKYMNIWVPLIGDEPLICRKEKGKVYDPYAVVIIRRNFVVGHVPQNICRFFWKFLSPPNASIRSRVLGKRVNHVAAYGLEITVRFVFLGRVKGVEWIKKKINEAEKKVQARFEKCDKNVV